ncbi:MAG TPA: hypothetical protein VE820_13760 [Sphingomicrobium sp.]|jgi:hypothetical protein|nr:hypothetical protein [Sphingomicrobium sp.]
MPKIYVYVGSLPSYIRDVTDFVAFGQMAELSDDLAKQASLGGCMILPADHPAIKAFTPVEFQKYSPFGTHEYAPKEFLEKKKAAIIAAIEFAESWKETPAVEKEEK